MTIKQHGGVFGRNPSFNDVSVETLSIAGTDLTSTAAELNILDGVTATTAELNILDGVTADATEINYLDGASTSAVVASKAVLADASGNIPFPNGKGIDFSATSGTGTSELLDDYEEGTWTPEVVGGGTNPTIAYSSRSGTYTKVGRLVVCRANIAVSSASGGTGECGIEGLPFTASQNGAGYVVYGGGWGTAIPEACYISGTASRAYFTYKNSATSWQENNVTMFATGASIWFIIIYEA